MPAGPSSTDYSDVRCIWEEDLTLPAGTEQNLATNKTVDNFLTCFDVPSSGDYTCAPKCKRLLDGPKVTLLITSSRV